VKVRAAATADLPQLLTLIRRYWDFEAIAGFDALSIERVLRPLMAPSGGHGCAWVAEEAGLLCGYLLVVLVLSVEHQGAMGEIDELFVLPHARSRGVGAALLAAAENWLRERGAVRLQLQLNKANASARLFYERRGYTARAGYELLDRSLR
jgi:GNAT superfamily N-acetyltransferase